MPLNEETKQNLITIRKHFHITVTKKQSPILTVCKQISNVE